MLVNTPDCERKKRLMTHDEVSWIVAALDDLMQQYNCKPLYSAAKLATLLRIMDILGYEFEDKAAAGNALASFPLLQILRDELDEIN